MKNKTKTKAITLHAAKNTQAKINLKPFPPDTRVKDIDYRQEAQSLLDCLVETLPFGTAHQLLLLINQDRRLRGVLNDPI